jgi:putative Mg2+ transporter-C (MgtC) family protein
MDETALLLRLLLAVGLSAAFGIEREIHGRPAGLRTHLLVGSGACLVVIAIQAAWSLSTTGGPMATGLPPEVGRAVAGVITGIGFLGAGTIIKVGDWVRGLTTAASLWFVASVGLASGLGAPLLATGGAAMGFVILAVIDPIAARIPSRIYQTLTLVVRGDRQQEVQSLLRERCAGEKTRVVLVGWEWSSEAQQVTLIYRIRRSGRANLQDLAQWAAGLEGVIASQARL